MSGICSRCGKFSSSYDASQRCSCPPGGDRRLLDAVPVDSSDPKAVKEMGRKSRETISRWSRQSGHLNAAEIDALIEADAREKAEAARVAAEKGRRTTRMNDEYELRHGHKPPVLESEADTTWMRFQQEYAAREQAEREAADRAEERSEARSRAAREGARRVLRELDIERRSEEAAARAMRRHQSGRSHTGVYGPIPSARGGH